MMKKLTDINEKLIRRADAKLDSDIKNLVDAFSKVGLNRTARVIIANTAELESNYSVAQLFGFIADEIIRQRRDAYRQREINEFMSRVENIRDEIDGLYDTLEGREYD